MCSFDVTHRLLQPAALMGILTQTPGASMGVSDVVQVLLHYRSFTMRSRLTRADATCCAFLCHRDPLELVLDPAEVPAEAAEVLSCCQSLVIVDNELIGDPLEKAALEVRAGDGRGKGDHNI